MMPPIFELCSADTTLQGLLSTPDGNFALYPFGEAPQLGGRPYVVWQLIGGEPENYLGSIPDIDTFTLQLDVYAALVAEAREVAVALRAVVEDVAHVVQYNGEWRDPETRSYRCSFTVDWFVDRT
jgi:hypothetical protein